MYEYTHYSLRKTITDVVKEKTHTIGAGSELFKGGRSCKPVQSDWADRKARLGFDARNITNERGTC